MKKWWCVLSLSLCSNLALAGSPAEEVQAKLTALARVSAHFTQVIKAGNREVSESEGSMAWFRPGRFRWETKKPLEQLVVADGKKLWIYDVDLEQVTVKKQDKTLAGTPALFLSSAKDMVSKDFNVLKINKGVAPSEASYDLHAKSSKENYQHVILTFSGKNLSRIEFFDQLGQHTTVRLSEVQNNPVLASHLFQFKLPKGVDVIEQ